MWLLPALACAPKDDLAIDFGPDDTAADSGGDPGDSGDDTAADSGTDSGDTGDDPPAVIDVFVAFTGEAATVVEGSPWLPDVVQHTPVSGRFAYASATPDADETERGWYPFHGGSLLELHVGDHLIEGSWDAAGELDGYGTFRFIDGEQLSEPKHAMTVDGVVADDFGLWTAFTDETLFPGDALPNPFPTVDPSRVPHTFLLADDGGRVLIQLDTLGPEG